LLLGRGLAASLTSLLVAIADVRNDGTRFPCKPIDVGLTPATSPDDRNLDRIIRANRWWLLGWLVSFRTASL
jgi:hypothetical protein